MLLLRQGYSRIDLQRTLLLYHHRSETYRSVVKGYTRINFYFSNHLVFGANVFFYTGPESFIREIQAIVRAKGMELTKDKLVKDGKVLACMTEQDMFKKLNMVYELPQNRGWDVSD